MIPLTIETTSAEGLYDMTKDILNAKTIILMSSKIITKEAYTYHSVDIELGNTISENVVDNDKDNFYLKRALLNQTTELVTGSTNLVSDSIATIAYETAGPISRNLKFVIRDPTGAALTSSTLVYAFLQFQVITEEKQPVQIQSQNTAAQIITRG